MNPSRPVRLLVALGSGALLALAFPPFGVSILAAVSPAALMWACLGVPRRVAALCGLLHGVGFYSMSLAWVHVVVRLHGGLGAASATGVLALMVLYVSLYPTAFALALAHVGQSSVARACVAAPFLWVAVEFAHLRAPHLSFPANGLGYSIAGNLVLLQAVTLTGILGLSFVVAAFNAGVAWLAHSRAGLRHPLAVTLAMVALLAVAAGFASGALPREEPRQVAHLVQVNLPQAASYGRDWLEQHAAELDELERLSVSAARERPGLIVWPEVPAPFYLLNPKFAERAERIAREAQSPFLLGVVDWTPATGGYRGPYNSAALLDAQGRRVLRYDKIHLVPFGEYVPLERWLTFARQLTAEVGGFLPGSEPVVGNLGVGRFSVFICYEAVFPGEVRRFTASGAELLVNISNDGWFGRTSAPEQHLAQARVRAVENRRWLLRATNNGHTVVVDPYGRITARLEQDRRGVLTARYDFRRDLTLYARWGDWFAWLCVAAAGCFLLAGAVRPRR